MITIDYEKCTRCNICAGYCPGGIIAEGPEINKDIHCRCVNCGHCFMACPAGAISLKGFDDVSVPPYSKDIPVLPEAMETLLRRRRSIRHYRPEPVSREHLERIVAAASLVPTAHNWRAFKAYVCTDRAVISEVRDKITRHCAGLLDVLKKPVKNMPDAMRQELVFAFDHLVVNPPEGRDSLFWNAPALLVYTTRNPHPLCVGDAWTASFAGALYAETLGVGTCYNGFLIMSLNEEPAIKPLLKIPDNELVVAGFTLGYQDEEHFRYPPRRPMPTVWI